MFEYKVVEFNDQHQQFAESDLNRLADEGWRLFSFNPVTVRGNAGVDSLFYSVILERMKPEPEETEVDEYSAPEGIAMRG